MAPPTPSPCPEMSEETRKEKLARAKRMLREFQKKNGLPIPKVVKKKRKSQNGNLESTTSDGFHSPEEMCKLREEKEHCKSQVQELESHLAERRSQRAVAPPQEPSGAPSKAEQLQEEPESLEGQLRAQVEHKEYLSCQNQKQEQRLLELEREAECWGQQAELHQQILLEMGNNSAAISGVQSQTRHLKEQLAQLQNGFLRLVEEENQEAQRRQQQLDLYAATCNQYAAATHQYAAACKRYAAACHQYAATCQQYLGASQHLAADKDVLHTERVGKAGDNMAHQDTQETQGRLEAAKQQKLQAQLSLMAAPGEGDGLECEEDEEACRAEQGMQQGLKSRQAMIEDI